MSDQEISQYKHWAFKKKLWAVIKYQAKHIEICICRGNCKHFKPNQEDNCPHAEIAFNLSRIIGIALIHSCKYYERIKKIKNAG